MTEASPTFERVIYQPVPRRVTVSSIRDLTAHYRRMTFVGDALNDFQTASPVDSISLQIDVNGEPVRRQYTVRAFEHGQLTIDFALNGPGPVSNWARTASVGATATILGPRESTMVPLAYDAFVLIGDETMVPAIGRVLESLPAETNVLAVIEVDDADDQIALPTATDVTIAWSHRLGRVPGVAMVAALATVDWPEGDVFCWAGGEATAMRDVRRNLLFERELPAGNLSMSGYWKLGDSDFDPLTPIEN